jgi:hypothetical protein
VAFDHAAVVQTWLQKRSSSSSSRLPRLTGNLPLVSQGIEFSGDEPNYLLTANSLYTTATSFSPCYAGGTGYSIQENTHDEANAAVRKDGTISVINLPGVSVSHPSSPHLPGGNASPSSKEAGRMTPSSVSAFPFCR